PELLRECRRLGGCPTGEARITAGYALKARRVIHAVGPVWSGGASGEAELLASCYRRSLQLASEHALRSIALPSISTGPYGLPFEQAARIAVRTVAEFLGGECPVEEVIFCCFSERDLAEYLRLLHNEGPSHTG